MNLRPADESVRKPHSRNALPLSPSARTVGLVEQATESNGRTAGDCLDRTYFAEELDLLFHIDLILA